MLRLKWGHCSATGLADRGIAGEHVDRRVEGDVLLDPFADVSVLPRARPSARRCCRASTSDEPGRARLNSLGGEAGGEPVERAADLIEVAHAARLDRRDRQSPLADFDRQALPLQQLECMAHRLARHRKPFGHFLLRQPFARRQRAVGDGIHQSEVDLLDQVRDDGQRFHN